jgi:hypothetical protein
MAVKHNSCVFALLAILALIPCVASAEGVVFSVSPGQAIESAQIGLPMGNLLPYFGLDIMGVAGKASYTDTNYDYYYNGETYVEVTEVSTEEFKGSAMLFIPHIGARFYLAKAELRPYVFGDLLKSFAFVNAEAEGNYRDYVDGGLVDSGSYSSDLDDETKDLLQKALGFWGMSAGFGCEYAFSEKFTLGGEYALRYLHASTKSDGDSGEGSSEFSSLMDSEVSGSLKLSCGRIWLNYHF